MGVEVYPPASSSSGSSKIPTRITLTSGTSWTVPTGVTQVNVCLIGGGGGGGAWGNTLTTAGSAGGTTTFTGATSATGGTLGVSLATGTAGMTAGRSATAFGEPGTNVGGTTSAFPGAWGQTVWSTVTTTPGASISYSIGAGGSGEVRQSVAAGSGAQGAIIVEYWV